MDLMPLTLTSTTSPFLTNPLENQPTLLGVPVMITVPCLTVRPCVACTINFLTVQIISDVLTSYLISPLTFVTKRSCCGSGITAGDAMHGPIGPNVSNDLAYPICMPEMLCGSKLRADTSFPTV